MEKFRMQLGAFCALALENIAGEDPAATINCALVEYRDRLEVDGPQRAVPTFLPSSDPSGVEINLTLEPALKVRLEAEARRQGVPIARLMSHALILHLANRDRRPEPVA